MIQPEKPALAAPDGNPAKDRLFILGSLLLASWSWFIMLAWFNIADGDLWAKLALGAQVWELGHLPGKDFFAFTPVLPQYVDHEWGSGLVFYVLLKWFGPASLLALKLALGAGVLISAIGSARRLGCSWFWLLFLLIPSAAAVLPGYVPVIRSHAFTYLIFAATLWLLECLRSGARWPMVALPLLIAVWVNLHGGFAAGLGIITLFALFVRNNPACFKQAVLTAAACWAATVANPYGIEYWRYLLPALLHARPHITEWQPLSLWAWDAFAGFRILFGLVVCAVALGYKSMRPRSNWGLFVMAITALLAWRSRRHAPLFGIAALAYAGPFFAAAATRWRSGGPVPGMIHRHGRTLGLVLHAMAALAAAQWLLPRVSFQVLAPVGEYPVREVDILSLAKAEGNLAAPFHWGSYTAWRLFPAVKVSSDGRYEAAYPESTFQMNNDFFYKQGTEWTRLIRDYPVDYVILDLRTQPLRAGDLKSWGYELVWQMPEFSALLAKTNHSHALQAVAAALPNSTIEPLDFRLPQRWLPLISSDTAKAKPAAQSLK